MIQLGFIKCHHFNMEQYILYSLVCDSLSKNLETDTDEYNSSTDEYKSRYKITPNLETY